MKRTISLLLICALLFSAAACGKAEKSAAVTLAADYAGVNLTAAAEEYNKTSRVKIELTADKQTADMFSFTVKDFADVKDRCADLANLPLYKKLYDKKLSFTEDGYVYGVPLLLPYAALLYNRRFTDEQPDSISDFAGLKSAARNIGKAKSANGVKSVFTLYKSGKKSYADTLLGAAVYKELETSDDYSFAPLAAHNAKRLALRYGEGLKSFTDLYKSDFAAAETFEQAYATLENGAAAFMLFFSGDAGEGTFENAGDIGVLPVYTDEDGEKRQGLTVFADTFFAVNKSAAPEKLAAASDFLEWILTDKKDRFLRDKNALIPYTGTDKKYEDPVKKAAVRYISDGRHNTVLSVSAAFENGFSDTAAGYCLGYAGGVISWQEAESGIKSAWEKTKGEKTG